MASSPHLEPLPLPPNPEKTHPLEVETQDLFKEFEKSYEIPFKRSAASMKIDPNCRDKKCLTDKINGLSKEL
jgi:chromosome segregation ATPase